MTASLEHLAASMAERATAFLESLDDAQATKARLSLDDENELSAWYYTPTLRRGLALNEMKRNQAQLALRLLASGLSEAGYNTACAIFGLENVLAAREGWREWPYPGAGPETRWRDPEMYFFAVFGEPASGTWAWRVGGHHVSVHRTIVDGRLVASTPIFFGADPATHTAMGGAVTRPLGPEEDRGRELLDLFDGTQRARVVISARAPFDIVQSNRPALMDGAMPLAMNEIFSVPQPQMEALRGANPDDRLSLEERESLRYAVQSPRGIAAAAMTAAQRDALAELLAVYINRLPDDAAAAEHERVWASFDALHFAWAGDVARGRPHYYRIQGPRLLVEYDNVQNGANHIHAVWRDPESDFGRDLLAEHRAVAHA